MLYNGLLALLPEDKHARFFEHLTLYTLKKDTVIARPGTSIKNVFFPVDTMVSIIVLGADGLSVEAGHIGRQGCAGLPEAMGDGHAFFESVIQIEGTAYSIPLHAFQQELEEDASLRHLFLRYNQYFVSLISQGALCNRLHDVNHRLARWLLMSADSTGFDKVEITHEYLASMLGTHRPSVTGALSVLEDHRAIAMGRSIVNITNRKVLEEAASPCYQVIRNEWERALGASWPATSPSKDAAR